MSRYQQGAYVITRPGESQSARRIIRVENIPSAPPELFRGRDQGHLAYPTEAEALAAADRLSAWEEADHADWIRRHPHADLSYGPIRYFRRESLRVEYEPNECVLVEG